MRKILLILSIAFVVVCYAYPCLILPVWEYKHEVKVEDYTVTTIYKFKFGSKVDISINDVKTECYYKLKGREIIISTDEKFEESDERLQINSFYDVDGATNMVGQILVILVGVMDLVLILTIPKKK